MLDDNLETKPDHHVIEHVIVLIAKPPFRNLEGDMPIAQMVSGHGQPQRILRLHRRNELTGGVNRDHEPIVGDHPVATAKHSSSLENDRCRRTVVERRSKTASATLIEGERQ